MRADELTRAEALFIAALNGELDEYEDPRVLQRDRLDMVLGLSEWGANTHRARMPSLLPAARSRSPRRINVRRGKAKARAPGSSEGDDEPPLAQIAVVGGEPRGARLSSSEGRESP
jgi:hypothetical protein